MTEEAILITGAGGEIGHALVDSLLADNKSKVVALDLRELPSDNANLVTVQGDITKKENLDDLFSKYDFTKIFHLAALLSTRGEKDPYFTHEVNVEGTAYLMKLAQEQSFKRGAPSLFMFPSTIAVYGLPSVDEKFKADKVTEEQYLEPITMYGINKLYVEKLGRYYSKYFKFLSPEEENNKIDFRALRYPGIMSNQTVPSGGTSDYGPEMIHSAAKGENYKSYTSDRVCLPFMIMPDAVKALIDLSNADRSKLTRRIYNVSSFSVSAKEIEKELLKYYPSFSVEYDPGGRRLDILRTWPKDVDDSAARKDWGWKPEFDFQDSFEKYLIPGISEKYNSGKLDAAVGG